MNATFHITADYMSYITAVAEFILYLFMFETMLIYYSGEIFQPK